MPYELEQANGRYAILKKQIYQLGIKAQSMVKDIQEETDTFMSDKDFSTMDFQKVETLAKELQQLQKDYTSKVEQMNKLKATFNISE